MTGQPGQVRYRECCQHCGNPLTPGGTVFGCTDKGGVQIPLPAYCADLDCRRVRDEAAIERAIERGVITRDWAMTNEIAAPPLDWASLGRILAAAEQDEPKRSPKLTAPRDASGSTHSLDDCPCPSCAPKQEQS